MTSSRLALPALALIALLSPALSRAEDYPEANLPVDPDVQALKQLEQSLARGQMSQAESQLTALRQRLAGDTRLEQATRQLSDAYLQQGAQATRQGDLATARQAAEQARRLLPNNPKLASLQQDMARAEADQQAKAAADAEAKRRAAEQAAAQARAEQQRQQQLAVQRAAAAKAKAEAEAAAQAQRQAAAAAAKPVAQLIDPKAATSHIDLPMLDTQDRDALRALMDKAALDVVRFRCAVQIQVREAKDYPFVAALLSARVKKLEPGFKLQLAQQVAAEQPPRLQLSPQP